MGDDIWGGGVIIVVAAGLWMIYLVPTWLHRREYLATERNALRLQQTMRILAETSEIPREVRLEMTARSVAAQERILRHNQDKAKAESKAAEAAAAAEAAVARAAAGRAAAAAKTALDAERRRAGAAAASKRLLRRSRAATSLILLASLVIVGVGGYQLAVAGTWGVLIAGAIMVVGALAVLSRLAKAGRVTATAPAQAAARVTSQELYDHGEADAVESAEGTTWTPNPLPKPLYLSPGSRAASSMASVDAAAQLRRAAAKADHALRAAQPAGPVAVPAAAAAAPAAPAVASTQKRPSRFAAMGVVDDAPSSIDLDAALRRRRAG